MGEFLELSWAAIENPDLSYGDVLVEAALRERFDDDDTFNVNEIVAMTGLSPRTVFYSRGALVVAGFLKREDGNKWHLLNESRPRNCLHLPRWLAGWPIIAPSEKILWSYYALVCGREQGVCFEGQDVIATRLHMSLRQVQRGHRLLSRWHLVELATKRG